MAGSLGSGRVEYHEDRPIIHWGLSEVPDTYKPSPLILPEGVEP